MMLQSCDDTRRDEQIWSIGMFITLEFSPYFTIKTLSEYHNHNDWIETIAGERKHHCLWPWWSNAIKFDSSVWLNEIWWTFWNRPSNCGGWSIEIKCSTSFTSVVVVIVSITLTCFEEKIHFKSNKIRTVKYAIDMSMTCRQNDECHHSWKVLSYTVNIIVFIYTYVRWTIKTFHKTIWFGQFRVFKKRKLIWCRRFYSQTTSVCVCVCA